jgi:ABC-2 type transport system ATP-binding protein
LEQHRRGATVIFSTHVMVQAEQICSHVVMIHDGVKVLDESVAGIRRMFDPRTILFEPIDPQADVALLRAIPAIESVNRTDGAYEISLNEGHQPAEAIREIVTAVPAARIELNRPSLEDVFIRIVTGESAAGAADLEKMRASLRDESAPGQP